MKKLIVVSGGSKGIGKAIVLKFALHHWDIITCSRNNEELQSLKDEVKQNAPEVDLFTFSADLSVKKDCNDFIDYIKSLHIPVDVLVNNTGNFIPGSILDEPEGAFEKMINTNLFSAYNLSRGIIPMMINKKSGSVFNICSTASIIPYVNGGSYCLSKFALYGMSKVLREELKPFGIKVTAVLPGATLTSSWDNSGLPNERFIKPSDIADTIFNIYNLSPTADVEEILIRPQLGDI